VAFHSRLATDLVDRSDPHVLKWVVAFVGHRLFVESLEVRNLSHSEASTDARFRPRIQLHAPLPRVGSVDRHVRRHLIVSPLQRWERPLRAVARRGRSDGTRNPRCDVRRYACATSAYSARLRMCAHHAAEPVAANCDPVTLVVLKRVGAGPMCSTVEPFVSVKNQPGGVGFFATRR
jgi:hypothetical protein